MSHHKGKRLRRTLRLPEHIAFLVDELAGATRTSSNDTIVQILSDWLRERIINNPRAP